ncbi:AraC family transcriptional regulator [Paenibacillus radicis (ex Gao et al. 2016)]|uniref:HTH araC/xylS-type domain-containing protein n=1 Tax=Paenibacillus radicis (ex Gao et al. 2016) TaxID=1737354 RepID=A0A917GX52_9BACL|nr:AraC family transcriptional regulator [Paenibacillus radicis (ex Gao et al. 2016)]GGG58916.1 hypothetical protein GCM10010918_10080 [Paenibacillus radicis (ex Gao et al. 2016)]
MESNFYEASNFDISRERKHDTSMPSRHYHNGYEIFYLVSGDISYFIEDKSYQVVGGVLLIIGMNEIHKLVNASGESFERITLLFQEEFLQDLFPYNNSFDVLASFSSGKNFMRLTGQEQSFVEKLFDKMIHESVKQQPGSEFYLKTLLFELLIFIYRKTESLPAEEQSGGNPIHKKIFEIVDHLNRHYDQRQTIQDVSGKFFISPSYFCKMFRENTGFTFTEYLNNVRVKEARQLLIGSTMKISDIAERVGFESMTHFGRIFKEMTGLSPLKYRQTYKLETV